MLRRAVLLFGLILPNFLAQPQPARAAVSAPVLKWQRGGCFSSWCQTGWYGSPAVADLDKDGTPEVIWGSYDVVAVNGEDGALQWRAASGNRVWGGVSVMDLTGDGTLEVIAGRSGDSVTVYAANGGTLWIRNPFGGGEVRTQAVVDLELDGQLEIVVGRASGGSNEQINAYTAAGNVRAGFRAPAAGAPGYGWGLYNQNLAIADLTGDGTKELIVPTDTHYITALDRLGNQLPVNTRYGAGKIWRQVGVHVSDAVDLRGYANCGSEHRPNFANSSPAIGDLDGDGTVEIVVVGNVYNCGADPYASLYDMPFVFRADRSRWAAGGYDWTVLPTPDGAAGPRAEDYDVIESAEPNAVLADLDGDGKREILYASYDGRVHAYWLDKTEKHSWPYELDVAGQLRFASEPVVADLDNDRQAEVIFTTWTVKGSNTGGQLLIVSSQGTLLHAINLPRSTQSSDGALGAPTLANLDADADLEVVVGTINMGLVAYDLPNTSQAKILWGTGRGGYGRTGFASDLVTCTHNAGGGPGAFPAGLYHLFLPIMRRSC
ncbi:MAG: VCBS repeat-containing protein [Anaerolineales bacterium]|nr:VCBS repeat-containing protein [Anaerolineales bacterium]